MQRLEVSGAVRPIYGSLGVKRLKTIYVHLLVCYLNERSRSFLNRYQLYNALTATTFLIQFKRSVCASLSAVRLPSDLHS